MKFSSISSIGGGRDEMGIGGGGEGGEGGGGGGGGGDEYFGQSKMQMQEFIGPSSFVKHENLS
jgi:hypothetical protein